MNEVSARARYVHRTTARVDRNSRTKICTIFGRDHDVLFTLHRNLFRVKREGQDSVRNSGAVPQLSANLHNEQIRRCAICSVQRAREDRTSAIHRRALRRVVKGVGKDLYAIARRASFTYVNGLTRRVAIVAFREGAINERRRISIFRACKLNYFVGVRARKDFLCFCVLITPHRGGR